MFAIRFSRIARFTQVALALAVLAVLPLTPVRAEEKKPVAPLARAHAHNDYLHERPLLDALDHGFTSVEADIFLVDGKLLGGAIRAS